MSIAGHGGFFFFCLSVSVECAQSAAMGRDERDGGMEVEGSRSYWI
jgi:hypothetical protein